MSRRVVRMGVAASSVAVAMLLSACGGGGQPEASPTVIPVSQACRDAFASVQGTDADASEPPAAPSPIETIPPGAITDLLPTATQCDNTEEWLEGLAAHPEAVTIPMDPISILRNLCRHAHEEEIRQAAVCEDIAFEPGVGPSSRRSS